MADPKHHLSESQAAWLAETFRRNSERFAGWRMEADPASDPAPTDPAPSDPPPDPAKTPPWGDDANFNPEEAWKTIQNLRREKGDPTKVADLERQLTDLQTNQQAQLDAIAKAAGLKSDDTPPDPTRLAEQITAAQAETATVSTERDDALRQLAVFRLALAGKHEGNPLGLIDSATFLRSLSDVDPTDDAALTAAVAAAVEANPTLKASAPTPPFPGGPRKLGSQPDPGPGLPRLRDAYAQSSK